MHRTGCCSIHFPFSKVNLSKIIVGLFCIQKQDNLSRMKKRPEGPPSGSSANFTGYSAASSTDKVPVLLLISVLTNPGQMQLMQKLGYFLARILV
jgi:hypothetical protein